MRRPAVGFGLLFAGGVGGALTFPCAVQWATFLFGCCLVIWILTLVLHAIGLDRSATFGLFILAAVMGAIVAMRPPAIRGVDSVLGITTNRYIDCTVTGTVNRDANETPGREQPNRTYFGLLADSVAITGVTNVVTESLHITMFGKPSPPPSFGERWELSGTLYRHVWRGKVQWRFRGGLRETKRFGNPRRSLLVVAQEWRRGASQILTHGIERMPDVCGVVQALLLGYRTRLDPAIKRRFANTGTMHIFAISGLHVAILCSVLVFAVGLCGVPRTGWFFVLAPIILLYVVSTGSRASAIRAGVMASAYLLGPSLHRRPDGISALAIAGVGILAWQPSQLFEIGFIFSFAAVAGILTLVPVFDELLLRGLRPDPMVVPGLIDHAPWWRPVALWGGRLAAVSLSAWLTSMPLSLYFFGRFAPIALMANLLVVPLAFLIIMTGCLSLLSGVSIGLWLAGIFNSANAVFICLLTGGMRWLEAVPYGHVEDLKISVVMVILWYVLLIYGVLLVRDSLDQRSVNRSGGSECGSREATQI